MHFEWADVCGVQCKLLTGIVAASEDEILARRQSLYGSSCLRVNTSTDGLAEMSEH